MASLFDSSVPATVPAAPRNIFSTPRAAGDHTEHGRGRVCTPALANRWRRLAGAAFGCSRLFARFVHRHAVRVGVVLAVAAGQHLSCLLRRGFIRRWCLDAMRLDRRGRSRTVGWHIARLGIEGSGEYVGRRAIVATLGGAGLRVSELCDLKIGQVRLHDPSGSRLRIPDAKTEAGIREVQVSPDLVDELVAHLDRLRRAGRPMGPEAYLFPNLHGGRMSRQRVSRIVTEASRLASERLVKRGLPPLPNTTPHSLRRTYVSIALLANNFDVLWVMSQVGHADSKMTTDVYAQLQQRVRRDHGMAFDALVRRARERLYGPDAELEVAPRRLPLGHGLGHEREKRLSRM